jgi:prepilin-type N-terminal cleavage/methylation domain-containing protein
MRGLRVDRGFTMTELMIALTIIGVLAAVAIPTYLGFVTSTRAAQAVADLQAVRAAVYLYYGDHGVWPDESAAGFVPKDVEANLPKNFVFTKQWYTLDYDNWVPLQKAGKAPNGTTTAIGVSVVCRDPKFLIRIQSLLRDAKFTKISPTKYTLEIATINGF